MTRAERLSPGGTVEPIFSASRQNAIADLLDGDQIPAPLPFLDGPPPVTIDVPLKNTTATLVPQGKVFGISGCLITGSNQISTFRQHPPAVEGMAASANYYGRLAVTLEPHAAGKLRLCRVGGLAPALVEVLDPAHMFAKIKPSTHELETSDTEGIPWIPQDTGTGPKWGYVNLVQGNATAAAAMVDSYIARLNGSISGSSSFGTITMGSGEVWQLSASGSPATITATLLPGTKDIGNPFPSQLIASGGGFDGVYPVEKINSPVEAYIITAVDVGRYLWSLPGTPRAKSLSFPDSAGLGSESYQWLGQTCP